MGWKVWLEAVRVNRLGAWRGAALARDEGPRTIRASARKSKHRVKQAAPANYPTRCFAQGFASIGSFTYTK
jgi:hypothetical protein